eukprot:scaffold316647_cov21-Tisochrysis_lutea.AAC.1
MAPLQGGLVAAEGAAGGQARACLPAEPGSRPAVVCKAFCNKPNFPQCIPALKNTSTLLPAGWGHICARSTDTRCA